MEVLKNDSLRDYLRGPPGMSGKDGSPGLKVSFFLNLYESFMHFEIKNFFIYQGTPGVGERGFTGAKGDRGDKVKYFFNFDT